MFHSIRVAVLAGTVAAATTGLAVSSVYAEVPAMPTEQVRYGDLDLNSHHGRQALFRRISAATGRVCAHYGDRTNIQMCRDDAMTEALGQLRTATRQGL